MMPRRDFLKQAGVAAAAQTALRAAPANAIVVDPHPLFDISPWLYMQFMEPLGVTDASVEASWDYDRDDWRKDFVDTVKDLAPGAMRFGGLFSRHYKWREGVGPAAKRPAMRNYFWGGKGDESRRHARVCRFLPARRGGAILLREFPERRGEAIPLDSRGQSHRATPTRPPTGSLTPTIPTTRNASRTAPPNPIT